MTRVPMVGRFNLGEVNAIRKALGKPVRGQAAWDVDWQSHSTGDAVVVAEEEEGPPRFRFVKYDKFYRLFKGDSSQVLAEGPDLLELIHTAVSLASGLGTDRAGP